MAPATLSPAAARRAVLAAQGFAAPRSAGAPDRGRLMRTVRGLGLLQLDSVNVAVRAHYAPLQARLGGYDRDVLDELAWSRAPRRRAMVEYWVHEASLLPVEDWPLLRWRMRENERRRGARLAAAVERHPGLLDAVHDVVAADGPLEAGEVEERIGRAGAARAAGGWWNRSDAKVGCEHLFAAGVLTTATRHGFRRRYDLTERVLPADVRAVDPERPDAVRALVARAAAALGVATEPDLRDYHRIAPTESRAAVAELLDAGSLEEVAVMGWDAPAYRVPGARTPRRVTGRALLAPFDPLVWFRPRTERLFGFRYRLEIYTPAHRREHGYYVFPFLLDSELVARVDLKADRVAGVLRVPAAFVEDGPEPARVARELAGALEDFAAWLGLDAVVAEPVGSLGERLCSALG